MGAVVKLSPTFTADQDTLNLLPDTLVILIQRSLVLADQVRRLEIYSDSRAETAAELMAAMPAVDSEGAKDPLFVISGGPGQAATEFYATLAGAFGLSVVFVLFLVPALAVRAPAHGGDAAVDQEPGRPSGDAPANLLGNDRDSDLLANTFDLFGEPGKVDVARILDRFLQRVEVQDQGVGFDHVHPRGDSVIVTLATAALLLGQGDALLGAPDRRNVFELLQRFLVTRLYPLRQLHLFFSRHQVHFSDFC